MTGTVAPDEVEAGVLQEWAAPMTATDFLHIAARIFETPLKHGPSPYLQINDVFPDDTYHRLNKSFPRRRDAFGQWIHGGDPSLFHGNYEKRLEIKLPEEFDKIDEPARPLWR